MDELIVKNYFPLLMEVLSPAMREELGSQTFTSNVLSCKVLECSWDLFKVINLE